jgi:hypothetical protein
MAAEVTKLQMGRLGAYFQPAFRLHSLESSKASACIPRRRLAVFDVSSICRAGPILVELVRRRN